MPSFKPKVLWEAAPHTRAKIEIVSRYLYTWFEILGRARNTTRLVYIDGFAGPGEYSNIPTGSPIAALDAAKKALFNANSPIRDKELQFHFIEKEEWAVNHLHTKLSSGKIQPQIRWKIHHGTFEAKIRGILADVGRGHQGPVPVFSFIDPFGATGLPFQAVTEILSSQSCEVLLNLDSDGIARLMGANEIGKNTQHLNRLFGDTAWRSEIGQGLSIQQLCAGVLTAYKRRLRALTNVRYVFAFAMNDKPGRLNYHLVFASQHPKGLEKMKEAMMKIDETGSYSFADDSVGQELLPFTFNNPETFAQIMHKKFLGQKLSWTVLYDYVLNETPYVSLSKILKWLAERNQIEVEWIGRPSKHGFPKENIASIRFKALGPQKAGYQLDLFILI